MRNQVDTAEDLAPRLTPTAAWRVESVRVLDAHRLAVRFLDGTSGEVDLSRLISGESAGVFTVLRDESLFSRAFVAHGVVTWPGELDLAPDAMYDAIRSSGNWTPE